MNKKFNFFQPLVELCGVSGELITSNDEKNRSSLLEKSYAIKISYTDELIKAFITPIDRDDLFKIASALHRLNKDSASLRRELNIYGVEKTSLEFDEIANCARSVCKLLADYFNAFPRVNAEKLASDVDSLEKNAATLYSSGLRSITSNRRFLYEFFVRRQLLDSCEKRFSDAAKIAELAVLAKIKNA